MTRNWIENILEKAIYKAAPDFEWDEKNRDKVHEIVEESLPEIIDAVYEDITKRRKRILSNENKTTRTFKKGLNKLWRKAFNSLELYISFNREYAEVVCLYYREKCGTNLDIKFETLIRLQARSCQIATEIHIIIANGFADGAMARWRSLYEIAVLSEFLLDKPEELIQKYLDYIFVENYYEAVEYRKNHDLLGYPPLEAEDFAIKEHNFNMQIEKYGSDFAKPYGWAKEYLPKGKCNFSGMEDGVSFKEFRSFYKLANTYVHSSSKGFLYKLGLYDSEEVMLAGPSNYGFTDPAQLTALFLHIISSTLSYFDTYLEDIVYSEVRQRMIKNIGDEFGEVDTKLERQHKEM